MTAGDLTDVIERTLREHRVLWNEPYRPQCACGEPLPNGHGAVSAERHRKHQAEAVTAAITEHAEVRTERTSGVSRTVIRFPWKDVTTDD